MKQLALVSALSVALLASFAAQAAETTELQVKGSIRPGACTPSFPSGGTVDYGTIPAKSLSQTAKTLLADKTLQFQLSCDGAAKVALIGRDNQGATVVPGLAASGYGLGSYQGKNIGAYSIYLTPGTFFGDDAAIDLIFPDSAQYTSWNKATDGNLGASAKSFAATGTKTPAAFKNISGTITVKTVIDKGANLPLTDNIPLNGSATIEVVYL